MFIYLSNQALKIKFFFQKTTSNTKIYIPFVVYFFSKEDKLPRQRIKTGI